MDDVVVRERWRVHGVVQGVGFRPFVHALATGLGLTGWVGNDADGVLLELQGTPPQLAELRRRLVADAPRLAVVDEILAEAREPLQEQAFTIAPSLTGEGNGRAVAMVPPDVAACDACLAEIADPTDRRYRYPFGNCTDCGPRFTVVTGTPYDRARTTLAGFALCPDCARERADPADRRFHAEPTACPVCGPQLTLLTPDTAAPAPMGEAALTAARALLAGGAIIAVKGLGGYHLACDAGNEAAVAELRRRKHRPDKPFALLVGDLKTARTLAEVDEVEAEQLLSPARPIVLLRSRPSSSVALSVAPGLDELGVQLPSTPLHVLLLEQPGPPALVLTSGNLSEEPIAYAVAGPLAGLVDAVLDHDRPIHLPCDDSVLRVVDGTPTILRRSRGYAPLPLRLGHRLRPVLAVGGDLKAAVCLASGTDAWLGQHVGDLGSLEGAEALDRSARHLVDLLRVRPELVVCDAHPGYASVGLAERLAADWDVPLVKVQHHHAHIASALAEHRLTEPAIGVAFDGTGYGCDDTIWGGELLLVDGPSAVRVGHLSPVALPGGDAAVRRPARSALAHLAAADLPWDPDLAPVAACSEVELGIVRRQVDTGFGCTPTSSIGRLYDAVAALCGVRQEVSYEAQAALELEALARAVAGTPAYEFAVQGGIFDAAPVLRGIVQDLREGVPEPVIGARFTASLAAVVVQLASQAARNAGLDLVALSGGVFANVDLLRRIRTGLTEQGLRVVTQRLVPCGDGGLSLGQAVIAATVKEQSCA